MTSGKDNKDNRKIWNPKRSEHLSLGLSGANECVIDASSSSNSSRERFTYCKNNEIIALDKKYFSKEYQIDYYV